jgi:SnoaL-like domain
MIAAGRGCSTNPSVVSCSPERWVVLHVPCKTNKLREQFVKSVRLLVKKTAQHKLSVADILAIQQLNARYALAFDDLLPDPALVWADTFTTGGRFTLVAADGKIQLEARGRLELQKLHDQFPDRSTTRHWYENLFIEGVRGGARMLCYFLSLDTKDKKVVRTAIYTDRLVKRKGVWKFQQRTVTLDIGSQ